MTTNTFPHGIPREVWEQRFKKYLLDKILQADDKHGQAIVAAELESWDALESDWNYTAPEEAASIQLSYWE